jgi:hypothetical protein
MSLAFKEIKTINETTNNNKGSGWFLSTKIGRHVLSVTVGKIRIWVQAAGIKSYNLCLFFSWSKSVRENSLIRWGSCHHGRGIEFRCVQGFLHPSTPALGPTRPPMKWIPNFFPDGLSGPGRVLDHPLPSSAEVKERVELYFYSPSGPSWPALEWTLPCHDGTASRLNADGAGTVQSGKAGASTLNEH